MNRLGCSVLVVGLSLMSTACGRKGPLLYPDMLIPAAPAVVTARQSGTAVKLQFVLSDKDRAGRPVQNVAGVKINKLSADADQRDVCRSCQTDYRLFRTLYLDNLPANTQRFGNSMISLDNDVTAGNAYSYSVVPFTTDGVDGAPSLPANVLVSAPLPAPVLKIESFPTDVKLHINLPAPVTGRLLGYNVYRSSATTPRSNLPLNREPLNANEYVDASLERGVKYRYSARTVVVPSSGDVVESAESDEVEGMLKDDE